MKRISVLAMIVAMLVAGSAFAGQRFTAAPNASFANGLAPTTTNNDDSCDISVMPAATLLLPYFAVDINATAGTGRTVLLLEDPGGILAAYSDRAQVRSLLDRHASGQEDATDRIWRLLNLQLWGDIFLLGRRPAGLEGVTAELTH